jgi:rhodanese-related sulfurtransferase
MALILLVIIGLFLTWDVVWWLLGVKPLFPWQLRQRLSAETSPPLLLDVRTPLEFNWFHLPGAHNVPDLLMDKTVSPPVAPNQEVVVICMTGHRSPFITHALKKHGLPRVYNLTWGMVGWKIYNWLAGLNGRPGPPKNQKS